MTVPTTAPVQPAGELQPLPVALAVVVAAHTARVQGIRDQALAAALMLWATLRFATLERQWPAVSERLFVILAAAQQAVAALADDYVDDVVRAMGLERGDVPALIPEAFTGASDGRDLETLLLQSLIRVRVEASKGRDADQAMDSGAALLTRIVSTQVLDSARIADQVAITVTDPDQLATDEEFRRIVERLREQMPPRETAADRKRQRFSRTFGYVRVLNPPSCARCAILAGRFYRWSEGFQRHDNCDCQHIPMFVAAASGITVDPDEYFNSLSRAEQDDYFGKANAAAIRDGADIDRVVNSTTRINRRGTKAVYTAGGKKYTTEATTKRGYYGRLEENRGVPRMTPEQIYKDAGDDRILALSLLERYGYIRSRT